jgi:ubiquinone biosynthesis protein
VTAVDQFTQISDIELDLRLEAAAAGKLADNMVDDSGIHIPWIDLEHTTSQMLVIEWVDGIRIDDVSALTAAGHDIGKITEAAARCFFNQVFRDGFFHADMHPGNIFIAPDGTLVPIDFGIMGQLDFTDRLFLARLLTAMLDRNYDLVARLHADAGMLGEGCCTGTVRPVSPRGGRPDHGQGAWRSVTRHGAGTDIPAFNPLFH